MECQGTQFAFGTSFSLQLEIQAKPDKQKSQIFWTPQET